jgi:hypothetical protein
METNPIFVSTIKVINKMTTSDLKIENNYYSFNVLASSGNGNVIDTYEAMVEENFSGLFEVISYSIGEPHKIKSFETEEAANDYALKLMYTKKQSYKK